MGISLIPIGKLGNRVALEGRAHAHIERTHIVTVKVLRKPTK